MSRSTALGISVSLLRGYWETIMRALTVLLAICITPTCALAGPISKFDKEMPDFEYASNVSLSEVERCLIDTDGYLLPHVFRQPDRPDDSRIVWTSPGGIAGIRVDLSQSAEGLTIRSWKMKRAIVERCAAPR